MPVYLVRAGDNGPVKIGHSIDPSGRLAELQVAHYETLRIIRLFAGGEVGEAMLHLRFADLHLRGEWYSFSRLMMGDVGLVEIVPAAPVEIHATPLGVALLARIEGFLIARRMPATTFGLLVVNDGKFVGRLRAGRNMTLATIAKADAYLSEATNAARAA